MIEHPPEHVYSTWFHRCSDPYCWGRLHVEFGSKRRKICQVSIDVAEGDVAVMRAVGWMERATGVQVPDEVVREMRQVARSNRSL